MENISVPPMIPLCKLKGMKSSNENQGSKPASKASAKNRSDGDFFAHNGSADRKTENLPQQGLPAPTVLHNAATLLYRLMGVEGAYAQSIFPLDDIIVLGRDPKAANIIYPATAIHVSRKHCCVWVGEAGQVCIKDLGSSNGTFFADGTRLTPNVTYRLNPGESFYLGSGREAYQLI